MKRVLLCVAVAALVLAFGLPRVIPKEDKEVADDVIVAQQPGKQGSTPTKSGTTGTNNNHGTVNSQGSTVSSSREDMPDIYATGYGRDEEGNVLESYDEGAGRNWDNVSFGASVDLSGGTPGKETVEGTVKIESFDSVDLSPSGLKQDIITTDNSAEIEQAAKDKILNWVEAFEQMIRGDESEEIEPTKTVVEGFTYGSEEVDPETLGASQNMMQTTIDRLTKEAVTSGENWVFCDLGMGYCNSVMGLSAEGNALSEINNAWDISEASTIFKDATVYLKNNNEVTAKFNLWDFTNGAAKFKSDFISKLNVSEASLLLSSSKTAGGDYSTFLGYNASDLLSDDFNADSSIGLASRVDVVTTPSASCEVLERFEDVFNPKYDKQSGLSFKDDQHTQTYVKLKVANGILYEGSDATVVGIPTEKGMLFYCTNVKTNNDIWDLVSKVCTSTCTSDFTVEVPELNVSEILDMDESLRLYSEAGVHRCFNAKEYSPKNMLSSWDTDTIRLQRPMIASSLKFESTGEIVTRIPDEEIEEIVNSEEIPSESEETLNEETSVSLESVVRIDETFGFGYCNGSSKQHGYGKSAVYMFTPKLRIISGVVNE